MGFERNCVHEDERRTGAKGCCLDRIKILLFPNVDHGKSVVYILKMCYAFYCNFIFWGKKALLVFVKEREKKT